MAVRRHGNSFGFWGLTATTSENTGTPGASVNQASRPVYIGQAADQVAIYGSVSGPTVFTVQVAPSLPLSVDGVDQNDEDDVPASWYTLYYHNQASAVTLTFTASGTAALILPDFAPGWLRLVSSVNVGAIAGWEVSTY